MYIFTPSINDKPNNINTHTMTIEQHITKRLEQLQKRLNAPNVSELDRVALFNRIQELTMLQDLQELQEVFN